MLRKFRDELRTLRHAEPGTRFELGHERTRIDNRVLRLFMVGVGMALMFTAAVTFWLPGPNFVLVFAGLVLVGGQSQTVARWMDRGELVARRWHRDVWEPYPHKMAVRLFGVVAMGVAAGTVAWFAYEFHLMPDWLRDPVDEGIDAIDR